MLSPFFIIRAPQHAVAFALLLTATSFSSVEEKKEPPFSWSAPATFDPAIPGLGLRQLSGVTHETLYAPLPSKGSVEDGGKGVYESLLHGTYNHHTQAVIFGDKVIVYWTNHFRDENGPGQRILARWGTISASRDAIDWGTPESNLVELVPPPAPVRRREPLDEKKDRRYVEGHFQVVDGALRSKGKVAIYHGWTDDLKFRTPAGPVPEERFRELRDDANGYRYDMRWDVGPEYYQLWQFKDNRLVPASQFYLKAKPEDLLLLTPTQSLTLGALLEPYRGAATLDTATPEIRDLLTRHVVSPFKKSRATYAPGTRHLAANGKHGLAHMAQFQRPDGTCVIIRDNLVDPDYYFAAEAEPGGVFPPAVQTNLFGYAMPAAGELPDGTCWILSNSKFRYDFFLTIARDGKHFDRTWSIAHDATRWNKGLFKPASSGPQYPFSLQIGNAIWVFYSVGKEQIAATRIPFSSLYRKEAVLVRNDFPQWEPSNSKHVQASEAGLRFLPGNRTRTARLSFPAQALKEDGSSLTAHLQFTASDSKNPEKQAKPEGISFRFLSADRKDGTIGTVVTAGETLSLSWEKESPQQSISSPDRSLLNDKKYDIALSLERHGETLKVRARLFGGDFLQPLETVSSFPAFRETAYHAFEINLPKHFTREIFLSQAEIIHTDAPPLLRSSTPEQEKKAANETAGIHALMADH